MKRLLLVVMMSASLNAERFVVHIGYHSDTQAAAFSVANNITGNRGVNINAPAEQANNYMMGGTVITLCLWILYKLYQSEEPKKKE